jgi:ABC-type uncharacterized transport system, permease component
MITFFRLFFWDASIKLQRGIAYRADFITGLFISMGYSSIGPLFQYLIFTNTKGYPGWNVKQIVFFQGVFLTFIGFRDLIFGEIGANVNRMVWRGDFDRLLLKPYEPMKLILSEGFSLDSVGTILSGLAITVYSIITMGLSITPVKIVLYLIGSISGMFLYAGFEILYCGLMLMVVQIRRIQDFINTLFRFAGYPAEIFPKSVRVVMLTVVPFMVIAWFPAKAFLGSVNYLVMIGLAFCFIVPLLSFQVWKQLLKGYTSAGG